MKRLIILVAAFALVACERTPFRTIDSKTMGTYYQVQYEADNDLSIPIDSILTSFIAAASTYDSASEISEFNRRGALIFRSPHLHKMLKQASALHRETGGAFEPTLMPLIQAYGFASKKRQALTPGQVDSLRSFVSFKFIGFDRQMMKAAKPGVQLDLSAMGEGYAIDLIAGFLDANGVVNYKVEIGGEMKCKGRNAKDEPWLIGIADPANPGSKQPIALVELKGMGISTSGTSRKFYIDTDGMKRSHIIDPRTGRSIENNLLSVTIEDTSSVRADVLATAFMVMGLDAAKSFARLHNTPAFIVYQENGKVLSWQSPAFQEINDKISLR